MAISEDVNQFVEQELQTAQKTYESDIVMKLRRTNPDVSHLTNSSLVALFNQCVSLRQKNTQKNGKTLEDIIESILQTNSVMYAKQVSIDKTGCIIHDKDNKNCCQHVIDFVIGDVRDAQSITNYLVLSCKTTCRERWTQDNWTLTHKPKLYILVTLNADYPPMKRFQECFERKVVTLYPKKKDDRVFPMCFNSLVTELLHFCDDEVCPQPSTPPKKSNLLV